MKQVRSSAGVWVPFPRGFLSIRGKDRVIFLHRLLTHDIKGLMAGQAKPACLLDRQGKIIFYAIVHARPEELLLELSPESTLTAKTALEQYLISEDVAIRDASDDYCLAAIHGPDSLALARKLSPFLDWPAASLTHCKNIPDGSEVIFAMRWDLLGLPGLHLYLSPNGSDKLLKKTGMAPEEFSLFDALRIEAGVPWPGREITAQTILNELGSEAMVSFTKGCYVGQEIVARIKYRAHPPRVLSGLTVEGTDLPVVSTPILCNSQQVGVITSSAYSPTLQKGIALGFLQHGAELTDCMVQTASGMALATITPLPFIPPTLS